MLKLCFYRSEAKKEIDDMQSLGYEPSFLGSVLPPYLTLSVLPA
jgi:hypothetical protein